MSSKGPGQSVAGLLRVASLSLERVGESLREYDGPRAYQLALEAQLALNAVVPLLLQLSRSHVLRCRCGQPVMDRGTMCRACIESPRLPHTQQELSVEKAINVIDLAERIAMHERTQQSIRRAHEALR